LRSFHHHLCDCGLAWTAIRRALEICDAFTFTRFEPAGRLQGNSAFDQVATAILELMCFRETSRFSYMGPGSISPCSIPATVQFSIAHGKRASGRTRGGRSSPATSTCRRPDPRAHRQFSWSCGKASPKAADESPRLRQTSPRWRRTAPAPAAASPRRKAQFALERSRKPSTICRRPKRLGGPPAREARRVLPQQAATSKSRTPRRRRSKRL